MSSNKPKNNLPNKIHIKQEIVEDFEDLCNKERVDIGRIKFLTRILKSPPLKDKTPLQCQLLEEFRECNPEQIKTNIAAYFVQISKLKMTTPCTTDYYGKVQYQSNSPKRRERRPMTESLLENPTPPRAKRIGTKEQSEKALRGGLAASNIINTMFDRTKNLAAMSKSHNNFMPPTSKKAVKNTEFAYPKIATNLSEICSPLNSILNDDRKLITMIGDDKCEKQNRLDFNSPLNSIFSSDMFNPQKNELLGRKRKREEDNQRLIRKIISTAKTYTKSTKLKLLDLIGQERIDAIDKVWNMYLKDKSNLSKYG
jgi:hypothetical protein